MGKSAKMRDMRRQEKEERELLAAKQLKSRKRRKVLTVVAAVVLVAALVLTVAASVLSNKGFFRRHSVVMSTPHYKVTEQMMSYFIYNTYETYVQQYSNQLGIDANTSLKKQNFRTDASWFDYFALEARTNLRQVLLFAEKAKEQGVTLTEEELATIDKNVDSADISAYAEKFALTKADLRAVLQLSSIASKMYAQIIGDYTISDADIDAYFAENSKYFKTISYSSVTFPYGENGWYSTASAAKSAADTVAAATTEKAFEAAVEKVLTAIGASADNVKQELSDGKRTGAAYTDNSKFSEWAFADDRKLLETYVEDTGSAYAVYQLTALPALDETPLRNFRTILLTADGCGSADKAKAKAEELLGQWKKDGATEDAFAALAKANSEEESTKENGGLYENIADGSMTDTFNTWCFDAARKAGDTTIVQSDTGYHVIYYVGEGRRQWQENVKSAMVAQKTDELCREYAETWTVTIKEKAINRLPL